MNEAINTIVSNLYFTWFALLIFFMGFCCSYIVHELNLKAFLWFPAWFMKVLSRFVNPRAGFVRIFSVIFLFNSISIMIYMTSGLFVIFPFIIAFMTGLNVGLSVFIMPGQNIEGYQIRELKAPHKVARLVLFSTLVLILEVLCFSIALGMGMSLAAACASVTTANLTNTLVISELLLMRWNAYIYICVPLLALSAFLEASVIKGV